MFQHQWRLCIVTKDNWLRQRIILITQVTYQEQPILKFCYILSQWVSLVMIIRTLGHFRRKDTSVVLDVCFRNRSTFHKGFIVVKVRIWVMWRVSEIPVNICWEQVLMCGKAGKHLLCPSLLPRRGKWLYSWCALHRHQIIIKLWARRQFWNRLTWYAAACKARCTSISCSVSGWLCAKVWLRPKKRERSTPCIGIIS
jgi:hypothetical protein